jgi:hypothetical protein
VQAYEYAHAPSRLRGTSTVDLLHGDRLPRLPRASSARSSCSSACSAHRGDFTPQQHFGFEAAAWYWHFVDVVWLFLFACDLRVGRLGGRGAEAKATATMTNPDKAFYPPISPAQSGMRGALPRCGQGRLFDGYLKVARAA